MRRHILSAMMSGLLILVGGLAFAEAPGHSEHGKAKAEMEIRQGTPIPSFEERLSLKPLTDEELSQISAAGLGAVMPFPFQPILYLHFAFPTHDFLTKSVFINPLLPNRFQF